jgi:tripartite-type tricarboxylate transporter receptor subunit TctC
MTGLTRVLMGSSLVMASLAATGIANAAAPYFEGKRVTMTISNSPGGGMDATARAIANLLRKYLPGDPSMIVSNRPGGNHIVGNNWFASMAARDGTDILYTASSIVDQFNRGGDTIKFDPKDYQYILSMKLGDEVVFVRNEALDRVTDLSKPPVVVGDVDGIRTQVAVTAMAKRFLGQNYRWTVGYPGGNELQLAFQKGEIEVLGTKNQTAIDQVVSGGYGKAILQSSHHRRPDFKDVPTVWELVDKAPNVPPVELQAFKFWTGADAFDHIIALPPKTDPQVVTMYREAAAKMVKDPDFRKLVAAVMGPSITENTGEETGQAMITATTASKEVKDTLKKIRMEYGLPTGE